tara:strand:+ start:1380 stop:1553 length:174 start_codon:yes stop_codon:yes gene_type:complete
MADQLLLSLGIVLVWIGSLAYTYDRAKARGFSEGIEAAKRFVNASLLKSGVKIHFGD